MKITLVRHGQTEYNYQERLQGKINNLLNDTGRRQVYKLKEKIKDEKFDICFSSPLIRTMETAMILVGDKTEIIRDNRLIERDLGNLEGHHVNEYDSEKYWDYRLNCNDGNVEPIQNVFKRAKEFIDDMSNKYQDKSILVVSHGAVIKAMHHILHQTDLNCNLCNFKIDNCFIEKIEK